MKHILKKTTRYALAPVAAAALVFGGHAQVSGQSQGYGQGTAGQPSATQSMGAGAAQPGTQASATYRAMRASEVIGADVRNAQGQDIGQIEDLIVNPRDGKLRYAVMSVDPGWFQSERLYSVPPDRLRWGADRDQIVLNNVDQQQLEQGGIERSEWNPQFLGDANRTARMDQAWGQSGQQQAGGSSLIRASDLIDKSVRGRGGENVGEIEELVLNTARGEVHYAVVSFDPGWLQSEKRAAIPLHSLQVTEGGQQLVLDMSPQQAAQLRDFNQQQYANLNDQTFVRDTDRQLTTQRSAVQTQQRTSQTTQIDQSASTGTLQGTDTVQPDTSRLGAGPDTGQADTGTMGASPQTQQPDGSDWRAPAQDRG